jgi:hypothetical protein
MLRIALRGRADVDEDVLVHQRGAERLGRDRTQDGLRAAAQ